METKLYLNSIYMIELINGVDTKNYNSQSLFMPPQFPGAELLGQFC